MVFVLHSSDDNMTWPIPVLSPYLIIHMSLLYSLASVHIFVPLQY